MRLITHILHVTMAECCKQGDLHIGWLTHVILTPSDSYSRHYPLKKWAWPLVVAIGCFEEVMSMHCFPLFSLLIFSSLSYSLCQHIQCLLCLIPSYTCISDGLSIRQLLLGSRSTCQLLCPFNEIGFNHHTT